MEKHKACCFIGHRKIDYSEDLENKLKEVFENLIKNHNVLNFLFGSRSEFDTLCHGVLTKLIEKYTEIKRILYTCKSESCTLESERLKWENILSKITKKKVALCGYEEEFEYKTKYMAGKASYIERNYAMIDDSDYCIFYYDTNYIPPARKYKKVTFLNINLSRERRLLFIMQIKGRKKL